MKRYLFVVAALLLLLGCNTSPSPAVPDPIMSYEEAEALAGESPVDLSVAATLQYTFEARVEEGELAGTSLAGDLTIQASDYPESEALPAFTTFEGKLVTDDGGTLDAYGLIIQAYMYIFLKGEDALYFSGRGNIDETSGGVEGEFVLSGASGSNTGFWQALPKGEDPEPTPETPETPDTPETPEPAPPEEPQAIVFPADAGVLDVTQAPYGAVPDDDIDDTQAIQKALDARSSGNTIIYLPEGTYLVSNRLDWPGGKSGSEEKRTILQGQSREATVIKLVDNAAGYDDPENRKAVVWTGKTPAQRFRNAVRDLTVSVGSGNPGASGIQFIANNQGGLDNVAIVSEDGQGTYGLDLSYTDEIGPMLVKDLYVKGFDIGIHSYWQTASITFEGVNLESQNVLGWENSGQMVFVRGLKSTNAVPVFKNVKDSPASATILEADLVGIGDAVNQPAIINERVMFLRTVQTSGYAMAVLHDDKGRGNEPGVAEATVDEWVSHETASLFESPNTSLNLPILETPKLPWGSLETWVSPLEYGGRPDDDSDDTEAIQAAIDSGAQTVYLPNGAWQIDGTVKLRENVQRFTGTEALLIGDGALELVEGAAPSVIVERLNVNYGQKLTFVQASQRNLVLSRILNGGYQNTGTGDTFIEDVAFTEPVIFKNQRVWARQLNQETDTQAKAGEAKVVNDGSQVWILGLKTEQAGTAVKTVNGGQTELLGAFIFGNGEPKVAPMFEVVESAVSLAGVSSRCFNDNCFETFMSETRGGETRTLAMTDIGNTLLYSSY